MKKSSVLRTNVKHYTNAKHFWGGWEICFQIFLQAGPPQRLDCLCAAAKIKRKVSFLRTPRPQYTNNISKFTQLWRCPHFLRAEQNFVVKWRHNNDIVSGFELCQMIAIALKFYEFCLRLSAFSPSLFSGALSAERQYFLELSYTWRNSK